MSRRVGTVVVAAIAIVAAGGCTSAHAPASKATSGDEPRLIGTEWQLVSYQNPSRAGPVPVHTDSTIRLDGKGGYGALACNSIGGYASIDSRTVTFRPGASTLKGCIGEADTLERQVEVTANGMVAWTISAHLLTLTNRNGHVLTYRVRP